MAKSETPLLKFLQALGTKEVKEQFAAECGTTLLYLYQLGAQSEPNPRLQLAKALKANSAKWARKLHVSGLDYDDLLVGAVEIDD